MARKGNFSWRFRIVRGRPDRGENGRQDPGRPSRGTHRKLANFGKGVVAALIEKGRPHPPGKGNHSWWAPGGASEEGQQRRKHLEDKATTASQCRVKLMEVAAFWGELFNPGRKGEFKHRRTAKAFLSIKRLSTTLTAFTRWSRDRISLKRETLKGSPTVHTPWSNPDSLYRKRVLRESGE